MVMSSPYVLNYQSQPHVHDEVFNDKDFIISDPYSNDLQSKMNSKNQTSLSKAIVIKDHIDSFL